MSKLKRILSILLSLCMIVMCASGLCMASTADGEQTHALIVHSGTVKVNGEDIIVSYVPFQVVEGAEVVISFDSYQGDFRFIQWLFNGTIPTLEN
ncbi:MAG: hypothetical protein J6X60_08970, partial [Ruminiclostridium sp.]|nr:hypothetical protein [Ruminiclostridium sp.]